MRINRRWLRTRRRLASCGVRLTTNPFRVMIDGAVLKAGLSRVYNSLYLTRRRILFANIISGALIAFPVYYLGRSSVLDSLIAGTIRFLLQVEAFITVHRTIGTTPARILVSNALAILFAATVCTYFGSLRAITALNGGLILCMLTLNLARIPGLHVPLSAAVIVACITVGAFLDCYFERKFHRRLSRNIADKQRTEYAILKHISHSINPTVQMALSPLRSVGAHLQERQQSGEVLARRRDGSEETVGAALETAVVSLNQIREIIETTEDIFGNRVTARDFTEVSLPELFEHEILPLFPAAKFRFHLEFDHVGKVKLHRPSFVQAMKNIIRNAEVHGFPDGFRGSDAPYVRFAVRATVKEIIIDCENNGVPFPRGMKTNDFLTFGVKGKQSPGKGLGGAWVEKFVEVHGGRFRKISNNPVHFRITLPQWRV